MTWTDIFLLVIALSAAATAAAVMVAVRRLTPLLRSGDTLVRDATRTLGRVDHVARDLEEISGDIRRLERRAAGAAESLLDQAEPPLRRVAAALAGIRTALSSLGAKHKRSPRTTTTTNIHTPDGEGVSHE